MDDFIFMNGESYDWVSRGSGNFLHIIFYHEYNF